MFGLDKSGKFCMNGILLLILVAFAIIKPTRAGQYNPFDDDDDVLPPLSPGPAPGPAPAPGPPAPKPDYACSGDNGLQYVS